MIKLKKNKHGIINNNKNNNSNNILQRRINMTCILNDRRWLKRWTYKLDLDAVWRRANNEYDKQKEPGYHRSNNIAESMRSSSNGISLKLGSEMKLLE